MSGPQTAQTKATLVASPSNFLVSPCRKARSRLRSVLRPTVSTMREVSACSASRVRAPTGVVARHARDHPAAEDRRHTGRLPAASARGHGALRGGPRQSRDSVAPGQAARPSDCAGASGTATQRPSTNHPEKNLLRARSLPSGHGTVAVDMDPLSLLCRLATSVPPPQFHTIHYAGGLAAASPWRSRVTPPLPPTAEDVEPEKRVRKSGYRPWAELLERTFSVEVAQGQAPRFSLAPAARDG